MFELKADSLELQNVTKDALTSWSDEKRKEFVSAFKERAESAKYILHETANIITRMAAQKKFIGRKHQRLLEKVKYDYCQPYNIRSRNGSELNAIANERASAILRSLPPLSKAISIIQPEVSKKVTERDNLVAQCKKLTDKFNRISETILISELDEKMTIGEFKKLIKSREKERNKLVLEINEISKEAITLEHEIDTALYSGIPGLSDAVVKVVQDHLEKEKALDQMTRRVEEQVMFGDSQAAMDILYNFEKDELKISDEIKAEFDKAMQTLKLKTVASKTTKLLKAK